MSKARSPFAVLGVSPSDEMTTIRMAWRAKVRALHPDQAHDKAAATAKLAEANAAFDALQGHVPKRKSAEPSRSGRVIDPAKAPRANTRKPEKSKARAKPSGRDMSRPDRADAPLRRQAAAGYQRALERIRAA